MKLFYVILAIMTTGAVVAWGSERRHSRVKPPSDVEVVRSGSHAARSQNMPDADFSARAAFTSYHNLSNKPLNHDGMAAMIMTGSRDEPWASKTEKDIVDATKTIDGLHDTAVNCRSSGCVLSGLISFGQNNQIHPEIIGHLIDRTMTLSTEDQQGDKFIVYRIVRNSPMTLEFNALGFRQ